MTDKYYMSGIYSPELHYDPCMVKVLPLVRELNYKYGLKVSSKVTNGLGFTRGHDAVLMSYPSGIHACAVWTQTEDDKQKYFLYSPNICKSRGSDQDDRSTISGKTVGIVTGLLNKYSGIPPESARIKTHLSVTNSMISMINGSVKRSVDKPNRYSLDDDQLAQLVYFTAHHLNIGENPNCAPPYVDRTMIQKFLDGYKHSKELEEERKDKVKEMFGKTLLMVGAYRLRTDGTYIHAVAGVVKPNYLMPSGVTKIDFEVIKPFQPVSDFTDVIAKYPEAMTPLVLAKMRAEGRQRELKLDFFAVEDHYEECVPFCTYYQRFDVFNMVWFAMPIEVSTDAL